MKIFLLFFANISSGIKLLFIIIWRWPSAAVERMSISTDRSRIPAAAKLAIKRDIFISDYCIEEESILIIIIAGRTRFDWIKSTKRGNCCWPFIWWPYWELFFRLISGSTISKAALEYSGFTVHWWHLHLHIGQFRLRWFDISVYPYEKLVCH